MQGFETLKIDCPEAMHQCAASLRSDLSKFRADLFRFAFDFGKESPDKKTLELDVVIGFLQLLMPENAHTSNFVKFLQHQSTYRGMSADHWRMWYEFATTVGPEFKEYDINAAWPSIIDEYVEHQSRKE